MAAVAWRTYCCGCFVVCELKNFLLVIFFQSLWWWQSYHHWIWIFKASTAAYLAVMLYAALHGSRTKRTLLYRSVASAIAWVWRLKECPVHSLFSKTVNTAFDQVTELYGTHFTPKWMWSMSELLFHTCSQPSGENIEISVRRLYELNEHTAFFWRQRHCNQKQISARLEWQSYLRSCNSSRHSHLKKPSPCHVSMNKSQTKTF